ncbi:hypothetical protein PPL_05491 [Heterostelium album PN500]|uniref:Thioredoxin domain-containing protein n=1 Tax=Heterostelium pallidum (strain ATCC 26659 / Pp 5 / PN500) TaxID=670386 RepID=D3BAB5_HETP5|nr:hypothetical protein PPL_05491 [Heterostelium album PN500]EFA81502.1 hypothetical protein PPL_05491 [Heterostelium album PN500]|eukprot:XP_020433619.1 hypothetical protein PPL_05491 [Heterostelium album PN500]
MSLVALDPNEIIDTFEVVQESNTLMNFLNSQAYPNQIVVVYFAEFPCKACDDQKAFMRALPNKYPDVVFFQVPKGSPITKNNMWCNDVAVYPTTKFFKNFATTQNCTAYYIGYGPEQIEGWIQSHLEPLQ